MKIKATTHKVTFIPETTFDAFHLGQMSRSIVAMLHSSEGPAGQELFIEITPDELMLALCRCPPLTKQSTE